MTIYLSYQLRQSVAASAAGATLPLISPREAVWGVRLGDGLPASHPTARAPARSTPKRINRNGLVECFIAGPKTNDGRRKENQGDAAACVPIIRARLQAGNYARGKEKVTKDARPLIIAAAGASNRGRGFGEPGSWSAGGIAQGGGLLLWCFVT